MNKLPRGVAELKTDSDKIVRSGYNLPFNKTGNLLERYSHFDHSL